MIGRNIPLFIITFLLFTSILFPQPKSFNAAAGADLYVQPSVTIGINGQYKISKEFAVKGFVNFTDNFGLLGIAGNYLLPEVKTYQAYLFLSLASMRAETDDSGTAFALGAGVNYFLFKKSPLYTNIEFGYIIMPDLEGVSIGVPLLISVGIRYAFSLK